MLSPSRLARRAAANRTTSTDSASAPRNNGAFELIEFFLGPQEDTRGRHADDEAAGAQAAGLEIVDVQTARTRIVIHDVAAVVYLLRKVIWWVPGFTVQKHRARLRDLHQHIQRDGPFITYSTRHLIEARRR